MSPYKFLQRNHKAFLLHGFHLLFTTCLSSRFLFGISSPLYEVRQLKKILKDIRASGNMFFAFSIRSHQLLRISLLNRGWETRSSLPMFSRNNRSILLPPTLFSFSSFKGHQIWVPTNWRPLCSHWGDGQKQSLCRGLRQCAHILSISMSLKAF